MIGNWRSDPTHVGQLTKLVEGTSTKVQCRGFADLNKDVAR
jgi:hypothetical protein